MPGVAGIRIGQGPDPLADGDMIEDPRRHLIATS
jgi:hypothetical protein